VNGIQRGRAYYEKWLGRARRRLAASGSISQAAARLAIEHGGCPEQWRQRLRALLDGHEIATPELLASIERLLATPTATSSGNPAQELLFRASPHPESALNPAGAGS